MAPIPIRRQPSVANECLYVGGRFPLILSPRGTGPLGILENLAGIPDAAISQADKTRQNDRKRPTKCW